MMALEFMIRIPCASRGSCGKLSRLSNQVERITDASGDVSQALMQNVVSFDIQQFIATIGYVGIFAIVFAESGLLIGFFLPGDSLLFTAGAIAGTFVPCAVVKVAADSAGVSGNLIAKRLVQLV